MAKEIVKKSIKSTTVKKEVSNLKKVKILVTVVNRTKTLF